MPIYYRNKRYSEAEREELWINRLDKQKRYIRGTEFDYSTIEGKRRYHQALIYEQSQSERMGFKRIKWDMEGYIKQTKQLQL